MVIKTLKDIEQEKREKARREFKETMSRDTKDIFIKIFKQTKKKITWSLKILIWFGALFLALLIINFILGNIWLFKTLIKNLFFGG